MTTRRPSFLVGPVLALMMVAEPALAQDDAVADAGPIVESDGTPFAMPPKEELRAYRDVMARFADRMREFEADAKAWVSRTEAEERAEERTPRLNPSRIPSSTLISGKVSRSRRWRRSRRSSRRRRRRAPRRRGF